MLETGSGHLGFILSRSSESDLVYKTFKICTGSRALIMASYHDSDDGSVSRDSQDVSRN